MDGDRAGHANQVTLGKSEEELLKQVADVVPVYPDHDQKRATCAGLRSATASWRPRSNTVPASA